MRTMPRLPSAASQRGISTLLVSVLLLAILTVVTLFGLNVGLFEQRTVGNETRARIVNQVADAGLNHGIEIIKANSGRLTLPDASGGWGGRWQPCAANNTVFPCGAEPDPNRRGTLYFYSDSNAPAATSLIGTGSRVATPNRINTTGGGANAVGAFNLDYNVGALLCLLSPAVAANPAAPKICVPYEDNFNGLVAVTLVSRASLEDDPQALGNVKATIASFRSLGTVPNVPIIASGSVNISGGTADIVPNPNAGGPGVALSIWAGDEAMLAAGASAGSGAVKTCHLGEFLTNFQGPREPTIYDGIQRCDDCRCDGLSVEKGLISGKYTAAGSGAERLENYDILDKNGSDVLPANTFFPDRATGLDDPLNCFDDNLFEYVFGIDTQTTAGCAPAPPNAAVDYLTQNATALADCGSLGESSAGLYWRNGGGCTLPNGQVGTPSNPLFLVVDCDVELRANTVFFGVIFIRKTPSCATLDFKSAGNPILYGALVAEGNVDLKGSGKFVYNDKVMQALLNSPAFNRYGVVPGSWTDIIENME